MSCLRGKARIRCIHMQIAAFIQKQTMRALIKAEEIRLHRFNVMINFSFVNFASHWNTAFLTEIKCKRGCKLAFEKTVETVTVHTQTHLRTWKKAHSKGIGFIKLSRKTLYKNSTQNRLELKTRLRCFSNKEKTFRKQLI